MPFDPNKPFEITFDPSKPKKKGQGVLGTLADLGKDALGGAVQGTGSGVRGVGEVADMDGVRQLGGALADLGGRLSRSTSQEYQRAKQGSTPSGELLSPSTWSLGDDPSLMGYAGQAANVLGQFAPTVAAAVLTKGKVAPTAAVGAAVGGGAAAEQEGERILNMEDADLAKIPRFQELMAGGMTQAQAREALAAETSSSAFRAAAPLGALSAFTEGLPLTGVGQRIVSKVAGDGRIARAVTGGVGGALGEGVQESLENASSIAGANLATGEERSLAEDSFANFALGALGGGIVGTAGGLLQTPEQDPTKLTEPPSVSSGSEQNATLAPQPPIPNPAGPLSRAVNAGAASGLDVTPAPTTTPDPAAQKQAAKQPAEQPAQAAQAQTPAPQPAVMQPAAEQPQAAQQPEPPRVPPGVDPLTGEVIGADEDRARNAIRVAFETRRGIDGKLLAGAFPQIPPERLAQLVQDVRAERNQALKQQQPLALPAPERAKQSPEPAKPERAPDLKLAPTGRPFKTDAAVQAALRFNPGMTAVKVEGGWALKPNSSDSSNSSFRNQGGVTPAAAETRSAMDAALKVGQHERTKFGFEPVGVNAAGQQVYQNSTGARQVRDADGNVIRTRFSPEAAKDAQYQTAEESTPAGGAQPANQQKEVIREEEQQVPADVADDAAGQDGTEVQGEDEGDGTQALTQAAAPSAPQSEAQKKALQRIERGTAYFASRGKAEQFIADAGLGDTHEAVQVNPNRLEVRAKQQTQAPGGAPSVGAGSSQPTPAPATQEAGSPAAVIRAEAQGLPPGLATTFNKLADAIESKNDAVLNNILGSLSNKRSRELFARATGVDLPKTVGGTMKAISAFLAGDRRDAATAPTAESAAAPAPVELVTIKDVYGKTVRVSKADLESDKTQLRLYGKDGNPKTVDGARTINRGNLDPDGTKRRHGPGLPYYARTTKQGEFAWKTEAAARKAVTDNGQSLDNYEIRPMNGGFVAVRKDVPAPPAMQAADQNPIKKSDAQPAAVSASTLSQTQEPAPAKAPEATDKPKGIVGRRADGVMIREDERGVRWYSEGGARIFEQVSMRPTRQGMQIERGELKPEFMTAEEMAASKPAPSAQPSAVEPAPDQATQVFENKFFTKEKADAARERLRKKFLRIGGGIPLDPEMVRDGIDLAGYHIERGARTFAAYAKAMIEDLGDAVRPYLKSWYAAVKLDPNGSTFEGMDGLADVEAAPLPGERRADSATRKRIEGLPESERDAEVRRLREQNAELQRQLDTDPLTGVASRAAYERDKAQAKGVATIDLKLFKGYNSVGGQTFGDEVLKAFGAAMRDAEADGVRAYRSGGDEFSFLSTTDVAAVEAAAARLFDNASQISLQLTKDGVDYAVEGIPFTAGFGTDEKSADSDLSSRKGDYDRNALPESIRRVEESPVQERGGDAAGGGEAGVGDVQGQTGQVGEEANDPADQGNTPPVDQEVVEGQGAEEVRQDQPVRGARRAGGGAGRGNAGGVSRRRGRGEVQGNVESGLGVGGEAAGVPDGQDGAVAVGGAGSSATDFRPAPGGLTREGSWFESARRNLDLIDLARKIEAEGRPATPEEQAQLSKYVGFGAGEIRNNLFPVPPEYLRRQEPRRLIWPSLARDARWRELAERADALPREWQESILQSTQYAHYTSEGMIRSIWSAVERLGFTGGRVLEPGAGIGSFAMLMPEGMRRPNGYTGIEFDGPTALIAKLLSPQQNMLHADFIKRRMPRDFFDLAIGNPPFAMTAILADPDYAKFKFVLHDFFFAKSIDRVRSGGLLVFVTSKGTMDKQNDKARKYLAERADLLGAIRLPSTAFEGNAGTSVVTDVIFLRKRMPDEQPAGHSWASVKTVDTKDGPVVVNEYFAANPDMVLGEQRISGNIDDMGRRINSNGYGGEKYTVVSYDETPAELEAKFAAAIEKLPANAYSVLNSSTSVVREETARIDFDPSVRREGVIYKAEDGTLMRVEHGVGKPLESLVKLSPKDAKWFSAYVDLRQAIQDARAAQHSDGDWEAALDRANKVYDQFRAEFGPVNDFRVQVRKSTDEDGNTVETPIRIYKNRRLLIEDYDSSIVASLETIGEDGELRKAPFLLGRTIGKPPVRQIKTIGDALAVSLDETGRLDLEDVARRINITREEAIEALGNQVFEAPGAGWQLADEYLSGDVVAKLSEAEEAARVDPRFERNVKALEEVQPERLGPSQISVKLGASWVPAQYINEFAKEVGAGRVKFDAVTESWEVAGGNLRSERRAGLDYGTAERSPSELLEAALNSKSVTVKKTVLIDGKKKEETDQKATTAANEVIRKIKDKFRSWVWTDSERAADLVDIYNRRFNNIAPRRFDGSHLTLPGVSLRFKLHPHQLRAIWRQVQTGNTYLAHAVGAGKTIEMIAGGMEQKRLGLIKKPIYVVPNHMLEQFANEFMELYPLANIMVADDENFSAERRKAFVAAATLNAPDAIVITHSAFERIGVKEESIAPIRDEILDALNEELDDSKDDRVRRSQLQQQIEAVNQRFDSIVGAGSKDSTIKFEDIGADMVFVDEAHTYRKLDFTTNQEIKGIDPNGSRRALDMYVKTRVLERQRPGRSLVMASGTPVTNTMGELYTILRFFASDTLHKDGIATFDGWARQFGEAVATLEANAAGRYEMVERFARFQNVPELMSRVRQFMDVLTSEQLGALVKRPDIQGGKPNLVLVEPTQALKNYMKNVLVPRLEASRAWKPSKDQPFNPDPVIAITSDGRFAALDPRFFGAKVEPGTPTKLNTMAKAIADEYHATKGNVYTDKDGKPDSTKGSTQIVFYNLGFGEQSQANRGFNSRGALTKALTDAGVKREHIAWFDDANTDAKKEAVFKAMRAGQVRILIGSAKKMGTGVNVQKRLSMLHYFDPPWYPSDVEQPHGRIIRQGNQNPVVRINWYATKGTYDSTMWQMVGRKQRFIDQAFTGDKSVRTMEDLSEASIFEQAAAVASGDPRALQLAGLRQDMERYERLQAAHANEQVNIRSALNSTEFDIRYLKGRIERYAAALKLVGDGYFTFRQGTVGKASFDKMGEFGQAVKDAFNAMAEKRLLDPDADPATIAKLGPADVTFEPVFDHKKKPTGTFELRMVVGPVTFDLGSAKKLGDDVDPVGLARRMVNAINGIDGSMRSARTELADKDADVVRLRKKLGAPFEYQQEMLEKAAELSQLEEQLRAEGEAEAAAAKAARQAATAGGDGDASPDVQFSKSLSPKPARSMRPEVLQATYDRITRNWGVPVKVVATARDLPEIVKQAPGFDPDAVDGVIADGTIYVVADMIATPRQALTVLAHEAVGHFGMEAMLGNQFEGVVRDVEKLRADGRMAELFAEIERRYPGADGATVAREAIAVLAERQERVPVLTRVIAALRRFLRGLGFNVDFTEGELRSMIARASRFVQSGGAGAAQNTSQSARAPVFYSAMTQALTQAKGAPKSAAAGPWKQWLDGAQRRGEFKQSERDWLGVDAWLDQQQGNVTREALAEFVRSNEVRVEDVVLGEGRAIDFDAMTREQLDDLYEQEVGYRPGEDDPGMSLSDLRNMVRETITLPEMQPAGKAKYSGYRIPGGENYREMLLTIPVKPWSKSAVAAQESMQARIDRGEITQDQAIEELRAVAQGERYRSSHWDQPNVLAHVRFDERADADGKRVLFINEIQSDWHQQGRKEGYSIPQWTVIDASGYQRGNFNTEKAALEAIATNPLLAGGRPKRAEDAGVPNAPLKQTDEWAMLAFKRMARWAVDNGFDRIAWATGRQAAGMFPDLQQIADRVVDDNGVLVFWKDGRRVLSREADEIQWAGIFGKEAAERLAAKKPDEDGVRSISGLELTISHEGMRGFYDRILPAAVSKWAKKFGAKVEDNAVDITPQMREAVAGGQPLFSRQAQRIGPRTFGELQSAMRIMPLGALRRIFQANDRMGDWDTAPREQLISGLHDMLAENPAMRNEPLPDSRRKISAAERKAVMKGRAIYPRYAELEQEVQRIPDGAPEFPKADDPQYRAKADAYFAYENDPGGPYQKALSEMRKIGDQLAALKQTVVSESPPLGDYSPGYEDLFGRRSEVVDWYDEAVAAEELLGQDQDGDGQNIMFSRRLPGVEAVASVVDDKAADLRPTWLKALTRQQLVAVGRDQFDVDGENLAARYERLARRMEADAQQELAAPIGEGRRNVTEVTEAWAKMLFPLGRGRAMGAKLANLMHDATLTGIDPSEPPGRDDSAVEYARLKARWKELSPEAQQLYRDVRDAYAKRRKDFYDALVDRIERSDADGLVKRRMIDQLREQFEAGKVKGPYFPLARFGDYYVVAENADGEREFVMTETQRDQRREAARLRGMGYTVTTGKSIRNLASDMGPGAGFVSDVAGLLDREVENESLPSEVADSLKDGLYQMFLQSLPEQSVRKHFIHRKGTPGFSQDALRAFASQMGHGAKQLSRLRYAHLLAGTLRDMRKAAKDAPDPNKAADIVQALDASFQWTMNPQNAAWANWATSLGFTWYLGVSPAAALVNLTQIPAVTLPVLSAKHGVAKSSAALAKASADYVGTLSKAKREKLEGEFNGDMGRMLTELETSGAIDRTMTLSMMGLGEDNAPVAIGAQRVMKTIGYLFHQAERMNREATAIAAYRLARDAGQGHDAAMEYAYETVFESHFDYSSSNRAEFMRGNMAKVLLLFRQYSQNITYYLARNLHQSMRGESKEVRREAAVKLYGMLGMTSMFAGALGLPLVGMAMSVARILQGMFGDDDEPFEPEAEFRRWLASMVGEDAGRIIAKGAANELTGLDIASRTWLRDLWVRSPDPQQEGKDLAYHYLEQVAGPVAGIAINAFKGAQLVGEGQVQRGVEAMIPKFLKDVSKWWRFKEEGATTLRGDPIVEEFSAWELANQLMGLAPAVLSDQYTRNNALKNAEQHVLDRRASLVNLWAMARKNGDADGIREAMALIQKFNRRWPQKAITPDTLRRSLMSREAFSRRTVGGVAIDEKLRPQLAPMVGY